MITWRLWCEQQKWQVRECQEVKAEIENTEIEPICHKDTIVKITQLMVSGAPFVLLVVIDFASQQGRQIIHTLQTAGEAVKRETRKIRTKHRKQNTKNGSKEPL
jgi:hypothetical protein